MIAVGGDVLSRGLTIEGLTVSYFYRIVGAADTLLQMARWFGYRPGYEDLVRVWISPDVADQFRFVSDVSEELRAQIREMRELGKTPEDFGLMVRKHPGDTRHHGQEGSVRVAVDGDLAVGSQDRDDQDSGQQCRASRQPAGRSELPGRDRRGHRRQEVGLEERQGSTTRARSGVSKDRDR